MATDAKTTLVRVCTRLLLTVAIAALAAPAAQAIDVGSEITEQPQSVQRPQVVQIEWTGVSLDPQVLVERRHGLSWVTEARDGAGDVLLEHAGEGLWSARWQPTYYSPSGTYRIRVEGIGYALTSNEFRVRPCHCVIPHRLRARWHEGAFRLSLRAEYAPGPTGTFRSLPSWVTTGAPVVRVMRDGRRIGSLRLSYRRGKFRGTWRGPNRPRNSVVFQLVSLTDGFGNN